MGKLNETVHDCFKDNSLLSSVLSGAFSVVFVLVIGSYAYTWGESKTDQDEKNQWRSEHEKLLERKFEEVRQGQQDLRASFEKTNIDTKELLKQILEEQRRANQANVSSRRLQ